MFKIETNPTFKKKVEIRTPTMAGGYTDSSFFATYNLLTIEESNSFDLMKGDDTTRFLARIIVELSDIVDEQGKPLPYSDTLRDAVLNHPIARRGLIDTYFEGIEKARKETDRGGPAMGPRKTEPSRDRTRGHQGSPAVRRQRREDRGGPQTPRSPLQQRRVLGSSRKTGPSSAPGASSAPSGAPVRFPAGSARAASSTSASTMPGRAPASPGPESTSPLNSGPASRPWKARRSRS